MDIDLTLRAISDADDALEGVFVGYMPAYRRWIRRAPADPGVCARALRAHMPELEPVHARLVERLGGDEEFARFLTLWSPPPIVRGCTQIVLSADDGPRLLRVYDHHPRLFDGVLLRSHWLQRGTLAMTDCLWGALDGINADGLAIALAFGGRREVGPGFGAPIICRYVLETCATVPEAVDVLSRVPVYMAYTFVVADAEGSFVTVFLSPDRPPALVDRRVSTNHQGAVEWERYARFAASQARLERADALVSMDAPVSAVRAALLSPPLWRTGYASASGSLYLAEYSPRACALDLHWPGRTERFELEAFEARSLTVTLLNRPGGEATSAVGAGNQ